MRPFLLGLTGSIGMGKSTTAGFFADAGLPVWDADAAVARLYGPGGAAVAAVAALCPEVAVNGTINRAVLRRWIDSDPTALTRLEQTVHPLAAADRATFVAAQTADIVVLDIPLLFETGADAAMDGTLVVTAPPEVQRARVLARVWPSVSVGITQVARARFSASGIWLARSLARWASVISVRARTRAR